MVHGGERFVKSVLLTKEVLEAFAACNDLAPLHNPANLKGVDAITAILPNVPQIGVFDTAFHQTMPEYAYLYAIPYELYKNTVYVVMVSTKLSHRYVSQRVCEYLGIKPEGLKLYYLPYRKWWFDRRYQRWQMYRYLYGIDTVGRFDDGYPFR